MMHSVTFETFLNIRATARTVDASTKIVAEMVKIVQASERLSGILPHMAAQAAPQPRDAPAARRRGAPRAPLAITDAVVPQPVLN